MNRSTLRKIWGDLWTRKGRTLLVSISIFIGVAGVVTLITAGDLLVKQLQEDIQEAELPMLQIFMMVPPSAGEVELDTPAYIADLQEAFPEITEVEGEANNPFYWKYQDEGRFREARLFSYTSSLENMLLEPLRLVEGAYPQAGQQELAVEQRMAEDLDFEVGDTIDLRMVGVEGVPTEAWTISAIVFHAYNDASDQAMYVSDADAPRISGIDGVNILGLRFTDFDTAKVIQGDVQAYINDNTPYAAVFVMAEDPSQNQAIEGTRQFRAILSALAIVAMLVSGFLVLNVVSNLVTEQKRQIGVMKSLGATRSETFVIYGGIAVSYGVMGMVPGVLAGIPLGYIMAQKIGDFANTLIDTFAVSPLAIILGVALGLAVPIISSILPVYFGTRVSILEAMTDLGIGGNYNVGLVNRLIKRLPIPLNLKQSFNNLTQKKARLALTVITLTLALTAFMGVSAVFVRINDVLQDLLDQFEFQAVLQTTDAQRFEVIEPLLMDNVEGIKEVYPGAAYIAQLEGYVAPRHGSSQVFIQGVVTDRGFEEGDFTAGRGWLDDPERQGIILTNDITTAINKTAGDMVMLNINGQETEKEIIGVINFPFPVTMMPWEDLARLTGFTLGAPTPNQYFTTLAVEDYVGTMPDGGLMAWGIDAQTAGFVELAAGDPLVPGEPGVMISDAAAASGDYAVGDEIDVLAGPCLETPADECAATLPITGIFTLPPQMAGAQLPPDLVAFFWQDLATLEGISLEGDPVPNAFYILSKQSDPSARDVDKLIDQINDTLAEEGITASFTNMVEISDMAADAILSVGIILNMASLVMAAVGAIGLLTTLSIAVFERQKEIGVMRSIGAKSPTIIVQFLVEGVLVGILAWIVAVPLSVGLAWALTEILPFGDFIEFAYPVILLPIGFAGILIIATISSVWPSVSAARKTVSNILRYQ
ncbi:MAG: FtsX-like permease family protein [Anaerolineae bacterium]|nr:FtsX-like permease family protein [Anaerolineae bacterium]